MYKNRFRISFLCLAVLTLTSCENFLKGADTKSELDRLIAEANAPSVEVFIAAEKEAGSVAPTGILSYKLGKTFNLLFTPATGYEFIKWQAVDRITGKELINAVAFENPNSPETRAAIKQDISNIQIKPVYIELPRVVSFNPQYSDYGSFANSAITFEFNTPMVRDGADISFDFNNITITAGSDNLSSYFYNPELLDDKKTLQIRPYAQKFTDYLDSKNLENLEIRVALNCESIELLLSGKEYKLNDGKTGKLL